MKVELNKIFPLESSKLDAWNQLSDITKVAGCMPGAEITEKVSDTHYKGKVKVRIGPVSLAFNGDINVQNVDADKQELHLIASGKDSKGSSTASMDLTAYVREAEANKTELIGDAKVSLNGKLVSFGGRMITQVADQILDQFADNFREQLPQAGVSKQSGDAASVETKPSKPNEINGLSLMWNLFVGFFKNLFSGAR